MLKFHLVIDEQEVKIEDIIDVFFKTGSPGVIGSTGPSGAPGMEGSQGPSGVPGKENLFCTYQKHDYQNVNTEINCYSK